MNVRLEDTPVTCKGLVSRKTSQKWAPLALDFCQATKPLLQKSFPKEQMVTVAAQYRGTEVMVNGTSAFHFAERLP